MSEAGSSTPATNLSPVRIISAIGGAVIANALAVMCVYVGFLLAISGCAYVLGGGVAVVLSLAATFILTAIVARWFANRSLREVRTAQSRTAVQGTVQDKLDSSAEQFGLAGAVKPDHLMAGLAIAAGAAFTIGPIRTLRMLVRVVSIVRTARVILQDATTVLGKS